MALWLVRVGRNGEYENRFINDSRIYLAWGALTDSLEPVTSFEQMKARFVGLYPDDKALRVAMWAGEAWAFRSKMKIGDLVASPRKLLPGTIAIGEITGDCLYNAADAPEYRHSRTVKWLNPAVPRQSFEPEVLFGLGSLLTIAQIAKNNAESRVRFMASHGWTANGHKAHPLPQEIPTEETAPIDLEELANDQIRKRVIGRFKGHGLARLVEAVLAAQGYVTYRSPEGSDKGIDVLAAPQPLGFGSPKIAVQVKSSDSPVDRMTLDQLVGAMSNVKADQGLLVSWGGFKSTVLAEKPAQFFSVRLWDAAALIGELFAHYDHLPVEIRAEIPLKRIWMLALEDEEA